MPGVLEETTTQEIDRDHIIRRVDDWSSRIGELYEAIADWLPTGWTAKRDGTVRMHEELMRKHHVPARELPILQFSQNNRPSGRVEPRGLWIIGANGRLDLFAPSGQYLVTDASENFQTPDWQIAPLSNRRNLRPLNRDTFAAVF